MSEIMNCHKDESARHRWLIEFNEDDAQNEDRCRASELTCCRSSKVRTVQSLLKAESNLNKQLSKALSTMAAGYDSRSVAQFN